MFDVPRPRFGYKAKRRLPDCVPLPVRAWRRKILEAHVSKRNATVSLLYAQDLGDWHESTMPVASQSMIDDPGEIAQLASEFVSSLDNLPQEIQHILKEVEHKDAKVQGESRAHKLVPSDFPLQTSSPRLRPERHSYVNYLGDAIQL